MPRTPTASTAKRTVTTMSPNPTSTSNSVLHHLDDPSGKPTTIPKKGALISILIILLGIATGYGLAKSPSSPGEILPKTNNTSNLKEAGIQDSQEFADETEGILEINDGSVTWEGTHKLIREGGPAQTAYLTSSVIDLSKFEGKRVKIKGRTFTSEKAGWLMDVGWIKIVE